MTYIYEDRNYYIEENITLLNTEVNRAYFLQRKYNKYHNNYF